MTELAQIVAGWPVVASMAAAGVAQGLRNGRRRTALNRALHELRRPLQAVALASGPASSSPGLHGDSIGLAAVALEKLDREINGGSPEPAWGAVDARQLVEGAVGRWQVRAALSDSALELRWNAGRAIVDGDARALAQAVDNLIVNAIEHGGPTIVVAVRRREGRLRIAVVDSGCALRPRSPRRRAVVGRISGRHRHGHGLAVVRKIAAAHDGRFAFSRSAAGSLAVIELALADDPAGWAA